MRILVYKFGLLPPVEGADLVRDAMAAAHRYRNTLTEIERARRDALREAESKVGLCDARLAVESASSAVDAILERVTKVRAVTRKRLVEPALAKELAESRAKLRSAKQDFTKKRGALREEGALDAEAQRINALASELVKAARAICGVYWGTYLMVEEAMEAAGKMPLYDGAKPNDPMFVRWNGEGSIGVQLQGGLPVERLEKHDTRLRVGPAVESVAMRRKRERLGDAAKPRGEAPVRFKSLHVRVGSADDRSPIWAVFPMVMHRAIPEGSVIKRASVHLRMIGPREEWTASITVQIADNAPRESCGTGVVAVDLGWRMMNDRLRVAYWGGRGLGSGHELALDTRTIEGLRKASAIQAVRSRNLDTILALLVPWLRAARDGGTLPSWAKRDVDTMHGWKSQERLQRFVRHWAKNRWEGDEAHYEAAEAWRYQDFHLWQYERGQAVGSLRNRREIYRVFAAKLARTYGVLAIEDFDLSSVARNPVAGEADSSNENARSNRHLAATSELRGALVSAFAARGGVVVKIPAADTTRCCHACKSIELFDAARDVMHICRGCGAAWDQDDNARMNLIRLYDEQSSAGGQAVPGATSAGGSRWAKKKAEALAKAKAATEEVQASA